MKRSRISKHQIRQLSTAGAVIAFIWLIAQVDFKELLGQLASFSPMVLFLAFSLYVGVFLFKSLRWWILLRSQQSKIKFLTLLRLTFTGDFVSNFLPSTIGGDGVRILIVRPYIDDYVIAGLTILMDRIIGAIAMSSFLLTVPMLRFGLINQTSSIHLLTIFPNIKGAWQRFSDWLGEAIGVRLKAAFQLWRDRPLALAQAFAAAWLARICDIGALLILAVNLGIPINPLQMAAISAITYFVSIAPITINGFGLRELSITALLISQGASVEQAGSLALISRVMTLLISLPGGRWLPESVSNLAPNSTIKST